MGENEVSMVSAESSLDLSLLGDAEADEFEGGVFSRGGDVLPIIESIENALVRFGE
jgi:hypothetical protein